MHKFHYKAIILIFLIGIVVYANSLFNPFIWDDLALVRDNFLIKDWRYIGKLFATDLYYSTSESNFYRPLQSLSYMFDYSLWKTNPFGYHLTNIILHISVAILVYFLFLLVSQHKIISLIGALFFVVHPIHTEAVTYISGRADSLMAIFLLSSFILFIKSLRTPTCRGEAISKTLARSRLHNLKRGLLRSLRSLAMTRRQWFYLGSLACFSLSLFCKEPALIFPFALLLTKLKIIRGASKIKSLFYLPFFTIAIAYVLLRFTLLNWTFGPFFNSPYPFNIRLLIFFKVIIIYLGLLILPINLHMSRNVVLPQSFFDLPIISSFLLFILILFFGFRSYRRSPLVFFGCAWFFIFLLPQSGLFPLNAFLAEHFLYLPSLGFFFLLAYSLTRLFSQKNLIFILIPILAFYFFFTIKRNFEWSEPIAFYEKLVRLSPSSLPGHNNLGALYGKRKLYDKAIGECKKVIEIKEDFIEPYANIARTYYKRGEQDKAIKQYLELIERYPDCDFALAGLADIYAENKIYNKAIERYREAIRIAPQRLKFYNKLGLVYNEMGEFNLAIEEFKKAIKIDNKDAELHNNLGVAYKQKGWFDLAVAEYYKALRLNPELAEVYNNLAILYSKIGQYDQAERNLKKAIQLDHDYSDAHYNLGVVYWEKGQRDKCRSHWEKVLQLDSEHALAKKWLKRGTEQYGEETEDSIY